jgi:hypothetical protein
VGGVDVGERRKRMNMAQILCTHVYKWKNGTIPEIWGRGIKENDGVANSSMIYLI